MNLSFKSGQTRLRNLRFFEQHDERSSRVIAREIEIDGIRAVPSDRFFRSFSRRYGISDSVFRYFGHNEVVQRVASSQPDDRVQYCFERAAEGTIKLLALSSPRRVLFQPGDLLELLERYGGENFSYHEGIVTSFHTPRSGARAINVGADEFSNRFVLESPVDGFGPFRTYISLLRLVCSNGMVGLAPAFRNEIRVGREDVLHPVERALASFDSGDGYAALRQRLESAQSSAASVNEALQLYRVIRRAGVHSSSELDPVKELDRLTGNINEIYGLANLDAVSTKRQRLMPVKCRVYDLVNFTTELATHHAEAAAARRLHAYVGQLVADEYDLEGINEQGREFRDIFFDATRTPESSAPLN